MHPGAEPALTHAPLWCLGSCADILAQEKEGPCSGETGLSVRIEGFVM